MQLDSRKKVDGVVKSQPTVIPTYQSIDELLQAGFGSCGHYFFQNNEQKRYILVFFNGAMNRQNHSETPRFNRWSWGKKCRFPVVCVSDPAVAPSTGLHIDWYLGRKDEWTLEKVWTQLHHIRSVIAPEAEFIVVGSSGGGFAALQSTMMGHAKECYCINPQIELWRFQNQSRYFASLSKYNRDDSGQIPPEHLHRFSVIEAGKSGAHRGSKIYYAQNNADMSHVRDHYLPFLIEFSAKPHNRTRKIHHISFRDATLKHLPPSYEQTLKIFGQPFQRLMK
ncbi:hypothetical protein OCK02_15680 [Rhizobium sp. TRM96647]|uniref:hypothetical protein n=1 Tax=unclassified Rhizobium TaxID=2613769 RepID=UPI0021E9584A|nr:MULTISPECIES: hypothetical protein [unclassified Rhizobium]MCV3737651.1 hypothetical protein [Rhizobium sp. TRM96647]MCV3759618.1 hypothetical protein [Rhizobium sp. TRM96650]